MWLSAQFRDDPPQRRGDFAFHLNRFRGFVQTLGPADKNLSSWWLKGWTEQQARLFPVFEPDGTPTSTALAVLAQKHRSEDRGLKIIGMWNGLLDGPAAADAALDFDSEFSGDIVELSIGDPETPPPWLTDVQARIALVSALARSYAPYYVIAGSRGYFSKEVFEDKPGVNAMLYLPRVITPQQVPEAAALVAVDDPRGRRLGTIVVSVSDEPFSANNPRHVRAANELEIRLVDEDLLPNYADFLRPQ